MVVFLANVLVLFAIPFLLWRKETVLRQLYWPAFAVKISAGIVIGVVYLYYYGLGDTLDYFAQGKLMSAFAQDDFSAYIRFLFTDNIPQGLQSLQGYPPRALLFSKITSIFSLVTNNNYWLMACYFSLLSFVSAWYLVKQLIKMLPQFWLPIVVAFLFFPSVVLWTSGLIKESLSMAALFFVVTIFLRSWNRDHLAPSHWVTLLPALAILWGLKYYFAGILLPVLIAELIMKRGVQQWLKQLTTFQYTSLWLTVLVAPVFIVTLLHPNFNIDRVFDVIVSNYELFVTLSEPDDLISYNRLEPTAWSLLVNSPNALFSGLFRPWVWEVNNPLQLLASLENAFLLFIVITFFLPGPEPRRFSGLWLSAVVYSVLLCVFLALSTPNLGTLSRYKVGFLPFLILAFGCGNRFVKALQVFLERKGWRFV